MSKITKNIGIIVAVIILGFIGYTFFVGDSASNDVVSVQPAGLTSESQAGREILALLLNLRSLKLDTSVFGRAEFKDLIDFGQPIPDRPRGRDNPFAPLGVNGAAVVNTGEDI